MVPGIFSDDKYFWNVDRLIELSKGLPTIEMDVDSFRELDCAVWSEEGMTVHQVVEHAKRIRDADLRYPIILNSDGWIMDGCHRLAKAYMLGHKNITAVKFEHDPEPDGAVD